MNTSTLVFPEGRTFRRVSIYCDGWLLLLTPEPVYVRNLHILFTLHSQSTPVRTSSHVFRCFILNSTLPIFLFHTTCVRVKRCNHNLGKYCTWAEPSSENANRHYKSMPMHTKLRPSSKLFRPSSGTHDDATLSSGTV